MIALLHKQSVGYLVGGVGGITKHDPSGGEGTQQDNRPALGRTIKQKAPNKKKILSALLLFDCLTA
ncbi:MAG: hypothetical protein EA358_09600 [Flavobacteriales bacterium]|nr:MAG: hypothetical protein EA358_09600 [Flavobacteriales bacterium]